MNQGNLAFVVVDDVCFDMDHAMSHPISAFFDVPHGIANAVLLPIIVQYFSKNATTIPFGPT